MILGLRTTPLKRMSKDHAICSRYTVATNLLSLLLKFTTALFSVEAARQAILESIAGALRKAQVPRSAVLSVCLAAAGIDRQEDIDSYRTWLRCGNQE